MRLIDADALKEWVETEEESKWGLSTDEVWDAIEAAPTIEPKRGRWEDVEEDEWICFKCSECGHDAYSYTGEILSNEWKFCPYCGARMERREDGMDN